ncbi:MAG: hypothetical protein LBJ31_07200 [Treponema sp.]|jgi:hypothetical protein|nr:hypothetical protein [Treponema sp.]
MKDLRVLLAGGLAPAKFQKMVKELTGLLAAENIHAVVTTVNTYEHGDLSVFEEGQDLLVLAGTNKIESKLPVVNGMGLLYGFMDRAGMIREIIGKIQT